MKRTVAIIAGLATVALLLICGLVALGAAYFTLTAPSPQAIQITRLPPPTVTPKTIEATRIGQASQDLGLQSIDFNSTNQARALLDLIDQNPNQADYQITYQTDIDVVLIGANFDKDILVRLHQEPDSHGTQEIWQGYIIERLQNAAGGGSLNDTPAGKQPGSFETF